MGENEISKVEVAVVADIREGESWICKVLG